MRFALTFQKSDRCCDDYSVEMESCDIPGAVREQYTVTERKKVQRYRDTEKVVVNGEKLFRYVERERPADDDGWSMGPKWSKVGHSHRREGDEWVRDVDHTRWFIDVPDDTAGFVEWVNTHDVIDVYFEEVEITVRVR